MFVLGLGIGIALPYTLEKIIDYFNTKKLKNNEKE